MGPTGVYHCVNPIPMAQRLTIALVVAFAFAVSVLGAGRDGTGYQQCQVVDLLPEFWNFWARAKEQPPSSQVQLFREMLKKRHPDVYTEGVLSIGSGASDLNAQVTQFLRTIGPTIPKIEALSRHLSTDVPTYLRSFQKTFPDFHCHDPVYFMVSFGAFDGATRFIGGRPALLFGVDVIAEVHDADDLGAFFDHELFHAYHRQIMPEARMGMGGPLFHALWEEGLATYVSQVLNTQVSERQILGRPKDLAQRVKPLLPKIAGELLQKMDDTSPAEYRTFFLGNNGREDIPPRSGYYVGLLVARELNKMLNLQEMAALQGEQLRDSIRKILQDFTASN
jgi:hypothetical protein